MSNAPEKIYLRKRFNDSGECIGWESTIEPTHEYIRADLYKKLNAELEFRKENPLHGVKIIVSGGGGGGPK